MRGLDQDLMKKVGKILIKTNKQDEITVTYVGIVRLTLSAAKKLLLWMKVNLQLFPPNYLIEPATERGSINRCFLKLRNMLCNIFKVQFLVNRM